MKPKKKHAKITNGEYWLYTFGLFNFDAAKRKKMLQSSLVAAYI